MGLPPASNFPRICRYGLRTTDYGLKHTLSIHGEAADLDTRRLIDNRLDSIALAQKPVGYSRIADEVIEVPVPLFDTPLETGSQRQVAARHRLVWFEVDREHLADHRARGAINLREAGREV